MSVDDMVRGGTAVLDQLEKEITAKLTIEERLYGKMPSINTLTRIEDYNEILGMIAVLRKRVINTGDNIKKGGIGTARGSTVKQQTQSVNMSDFHIVGDVDDGFAKKE